MIFLHPVNLFINISSKIKVCFRCGKPKNILISFLELLISALLDKVKSRANSMVLFNGMFVKMLPVSNDNEKLLYSLTSSRSLMKVNVSCVLCIWIWELQ